MSIEYEIELSFLMIIHFCVDVHHHSKSLILKYFSLNGLGRWETCKNLVLSLLLIDKKNSL